MKLHRHPHIVRMDIDGVRIIQTSRRGLTRMHISQDIMEWLVDRTGGNNSRDWLWSGQYDFDHNHNYAEFSFANANDALLFKLTWGGA